MSLRINPDAMRTGREVVRHKIGYGTSVFRMLPPTENSNGYPYKKWMITWGLLDPVKGTKRPYASSFLDEGRCPVREYYLLVLKKLEDTEAEMKAQGMSDDDIKLELKDFIALVRNLRLKTVYSYNSADQSGKVGLLEAIPTVQKQIKKIMGEYYSEFGQDPTSLNNDPEDSGIWFKIEKTGQLLNTEYFVSKNQKAERLPDGRKVSVDDNTALPKDIVTNYDKLAYDLNECYQRLTYDELRAVLMSNIARWANDVPEMVVEGFDDFEKVALAATPSAVKPAPVAATPKTVVTPKAKPVTTKGLVEEDTDDDDDFMKEAERLLEDAK